MEIFEQLETLEKKIKETFGENIRSIELISRVRGTVDHNGESFYKVENSDGKFALVIGKVFECYTPSLIYHYFLGYDVQIKQLIDFDCEEIFAHDYQGNIFYFKVDGKWGVIKFIGFDNEVGVEPIYDRIEEAGSYEFKLYQGESFDVVCLSDEGLKYLVKNGNPCDSQVRVRKDKKIE